MQDVLDRMLADSSGIKPEAQAILAAANAEMANQNPPIENQELVNDEVQTTSNNEQQTNQPPTELDDNHYLRILGEKLGGEYKTWDDIKSKFRDPNYELQIQSRQEELDKLRQDLQDKENILAEYNSPLKYFNNDENLYKRVQLQAAHPELNSKVLDVIVNGVGEISNLEKVVLERQLLVPNLSEIDAKALVAEELGISVDDEWEESLKNLTTIQNAKLTIKANEASKNLSKYAEEIKAPAKFDPEAIKQSNAQKQEQQKAQIQGSWKSVLSVLSSDKAIEAFEETNKEGKIEKTLLQKLEMDDNFMKSIPEKFLQIALAANLPANETNYGLIMNRLKADYFYENRTKLIKQIQSDIESKVYNSKTNASGVRNEPRVIVKDVDKPVISGGIAKAFGIY